MLLSPRLTAALLDARRHIRLSCCDEHCHWKEGFEDDCVTRLDSKTWREKIRPDSLRTQRTNNHRRSSRCAIHVHACESSNVYNAMYYDSRNLLIYAMIMESNGILNLTPRKVRLPLLV